MSDDEKDLKRFWELVSDWVNEGKLPEMRHEDILEPVILAFAREKVGEARRRWLVDQDLMSYNAHFRAVVAVERDTKDKVDAAVKEATIASAARIRDMRRVLEEFREVLARLGAKNCGESIDKVEVPGGPWRREIEAVLDTRDKDHADQWKRDLAEAVARAIAKIWSDMEVCAKSFVRWEPSVAEKGVGNVTCANWVMRRCDVKDEKCQVYHWQLFAEDFVRQVIGQIRKH